MLIEEKADSIDSLVCYDIKNNYGQETYTADFSQEYDNVSVRCSENSFRFEWLTDSSFLEVAEVIDQEYPVLYRVEGVREHSSPDHLRKAHDDFKLYHLGNGRADLDDFSRLDIYFNDLMVYWDPNISNTRDNRQDLNRVRMVSEGAGIWPFEHLFPDTCSLDEEDANELLQDIEKLFGFRNESIDLESGI